MDHTLIWFYLDNKMHQLFFYMAKADRDTMDVQNCIWCWFLNIKVNRTRDVIIVKGMMEWKMNAMGDNFFLNLAVICHHLHQV